MRLKLVIRLHAMNILVTGAAGFIGFHVCKRLLERGVQVTGIDNLNDYYDVSLKRARLALLEPYEGFTFVKIDIADRNAMEELFKTGAFERVVNLAAQAGVRYSIENPHAYIESNIVGFLNVLEGCRHNGVKHLVYASSSKELQRKAEQFNGKNVSVTGQLVIKPGIEVKERKIVTIFTLEEIK